MLEGIFVLVEDGALVETVVEGALLEVGDFVDEDEKGWVLLDGIDTNNLRLS